ncbi:anti-sigma factor family protein [Bacillaceae bacterium W0354]
MKNIHLTEEQIIDFVEGLLDEAERSIVQNHLNECESCFNQYLSWKNILESDVELNELDQKKVWHNVQQDLQEKRVREVSNKKGLMYGAWVASCLFFLFIGYMLGGQGGHSNLTMAEQETEENIETFVNRPVEHYNMVNSEGGESQGVAWYNPYNKQMILYLNDPNHLNRQLQEIQIETENRIIPIKPNHLHDGKVQFYVRDQDLQDLMQLIVIPEEDDAFRQTYYFQMSP